MVDFLTLWQDASKESCPDPKGAAGRLVTALAELLEVEQVEYDQIGKAALFLLDLGTLGFRGMDLNVVMVTHPPEDDEEKKRQVGLLSDYRTAVESFGFCLHMVLSWNLPPRNEFVSSSLEVVVFSGNDLDRIFASQIPSSVLFGVIRRQAHLEQICPYNTNHAARGGMFKGRRRELHYLTRILDTNYLISSSRRIGKTSLVLRAYSSLHKHREIRNRVFFFNCISWGGFIDCCTRIAHQVNPRQELRIEQGRRGLSYLLERESSSGTSPLLLFFDELDRVVDHDASDNWRFFQVLAEAAERRWIRVVFVGYRSVQHLNTGTNSTAAHTQRYSNSPFYRRLTTIVLEPLSREDTTSLIAEPFESLGMQIQDRKRFTERIWTHTKGHPFLIQFFGERLFRQTSERGQMLICPDDVEIVERSRDLDSFLLTHFIENTIDKGKPVNSERICAFMFAQYAQSNGWTQGDFIEQSTKVGHKLSMDEVQDALGNLVNAAIFSYDNRKYSFTFPLLADIIRANYPNAGVILDTLDSR